MISIKPVALNASFSIRDNLDRDSIVTEESDLQSEKHSSPKTSTDEIIINSNKALKKYARFTIRDNLDPDSNVTEESEMHLEKHL
jgi:hypothetical protein